MILIIAEQRLLSFRFTAARFAACGVQTHKRAQKGSPVPPNLLLVLLPIVGVSE